MAKGKAAIFLRKQRNQLIGHRFMRSPDGTLVSFDPTGSVTTFPLAINKAGVVTGEYYDSKGNFHGFVRAADGTITNFDGPGAKYTAGLAINSKGTVTGYYQDSTANHGFVRIADGTLTTFDYPDAVATIVRASMPRAKSRGCIRMSPDTCMASHGRSGER
jgi:hypothetical protein